MTTIDPRTPVLAGFAVTTQREEDFRRAREPLALMLDAVQRAGDDCGAAQALASVDWIAVPKGRWQYSNPSGAIARSIGAIHATTVLASVGVLQQSLIGAACARIARGESAMALVVGGDAGYRLLRAQIAGGAAPDTQQHSAPDVYWTPADELRHPIERAAGLQMPVGLYALIESAYRFEQRLSVDAHRDRLASLYERMSGIAARNPHAWQQTAVAAATIREPGPKNPMQAFPYTKLHCSSWNVDQAAALLFCSHDRADALGIPMLKRIYPLASTESNHMVPVVERARLATCPGAAIAGQAALASVNLDVAELDLVELYSCFPVAVELFADAIGIALERPLTVTGGMPFAGGPYNNYVLQATCRAAELLRAMREATKAEQRPRTALVGSVSGILTKQGFGLWSTTPPTAFLHADVTSDVAQATERREVVAGYRGPATVAACTVLHVRGEAAKAVALCDTPQGCRTLAVTDDSSLVMAIESEEMVGRGLRIDGQRLAA